MECSGSSLRALAARVPTVTRVPVLTWAPVALGLIVAVTGPVPLRGGAVARPAADAVTGHGPPGPSSSDSPLPDTLSSRIDSLVRELETRIVGIRHRIHRNPELANREDSTAALVAAHLRELGFDAVRTGVAHTGVVGVLRGGRPGPVVAVRADMDALPVTEETGFSFASTKRTTYLGQEVGVMHACGHDVHTSVQLGLASILAAMREELSGTVRFVFQPAEEGPPPGEDGGARLMVEEDALTDPLPRPDAIFAFHSEPQLEVGEVGYTVGPALAAVDHFRIELRGRQAHGARPEEAVDPVVAASQAVVALQGIVSRNVPPLQPAVVTVGILRGGERYNIIPGSVHLEGTVRTYEPAVRDLVERRMRETLAGVTASAGADFTLDYERETPPTFNDTTLSRLAVPVLEATVGEEDARALPPVMWGEDFPFFTREIPGFYFRLGTTEPGGESGGLHTPDFRGSDGAIPVGMRLMARLVVRYLEEGAG